LGQYELRSTREGARLRHLAAGSRLDASALRAKARGDTRVVCQRGSLRRAIRSINSARRKGYVLRPSQGSKRGNRIYDNWRRGTMLIYVPDQLSDETNTTANSTSHRNQYHDNVMGIAPNGSKMPNGVDFWWDEAPGQEDNCWYDNGAVTTDPPAPLMPSNCDNTSAGVTYAGKLSSELLPCAGAIGGGGFDPNTCPWFRSPEKPSSDGGGPMGLPAQASGVPKLTLLTGNCRIVGTTVSCDGLLDRP
jgi:hypothetical protein